MSSLRAGLVLVFLGLVAPTGLIWTTAPAHAEGDGGDAGGDSGEDSGGESDQASDEDESEEAVRARSAAQAQALDFSTLNTGQIPNQTVTVTLGASRFAQP